MADEKSTAPFMLVYYRYGARYQDPCDSIDDAIQRAAWGAEFGELSQECILDADGSVFLDRAALTDAIHAVWAAKDAREDLAHG